MSNLIPAEPEFKIMKDLALMAVKSGLLPQGINTPEKALIIALKGRELGIPMMQAFSHIHVINGKPTISSELMLTQIYKCIPKVSINYIQSNDKACIIEAQRPNSDKARWGFTIEDAEKAQLLSKGPWKQYPAAMLRARAIAIMARAQFPDCLNGVSYTPEELGSDIEIDDNGTEIVKDVSPQQETKPPLKPEDRPVEKVKHIVNTINTSLEKDRQDMLNKIEKDIPKTRPVGVVNHALNVVVDMLPSLKGGDSSDRV